MRVIVTIAASCLLAGCATKPNKISTAYVPHSIYESYTCDQLIAERRRIVAKTDELTKRQSRAAGEDKKSELATNKGTYDAIVRASIQKGCFQGLA